MDVYGIIYAFTWMYMAYDVYTYYIYIFSILIYIHMGINIDSHIFYYT